MKTLRVWISTISILVTVVSGCHPIEKGVKETDTAVSDIRLVDYGTYREVATKSIRAGRDGDRIIDEQRVEIEKKKIETTDHIEVAKGILFGLEFEIVGTPRNETVEIDIYHTHPPIRQPNKLPFEEQHYTVERKTGGVYHALYMLEEEWELVTGTWTIALVFQGKQYVEKRFELIPAASRM